MKTNIVIAIIKLILLMASQSALAYNKPCAVEEGLNLIDQASPPLTEIKNILIRCDQEMPNEASVLFLHGLVARKEAMATHHYQSAIDWLEKAKSVSSDYLPILLSLAVTYEWAAQPEKARLIYTAILAKHSNFHPALLGEARVAIAENNLVLAIQIYKRLLKSNAKDIEALNGMGRTNLAHHQPWIAQNYFQKTLHNDPNNADALIGLQQIKQMLSQTQSVAANIKNSCQVAEGLRLVNLPNPPFNEIKMILIACDKESPNDGQVLLLHGLLARKQGMAKQHYQLAIEWLQKAVNEAPKDYFIPALELAVTYEWVQQLDRAKSIYTKLLSENKELRAALLGAARIAVAQSHLVFAEHIYLSLLQKNPNDIDALNGLARVKLANQQYQSATSYFQKVRTLSPNNADALLGLQQIQAAKQFKQSKPHLTMFCNANEGLRLLNQVTIPFNKIKHILAVCDKAAPRDVQTLLLHGLLARKEGMASGQYQVAIDWLQQAREHAAPHDMVPALELAVTYEWANEPDKAQAIYNQILATDPMSRPALLGDARIDRSQYQLEKSSAIYQQFLKKDAKDIEALNGMGWVNLTNKNFKAAKYYFESVLAMSPDNTDAKIGLALLHDLTRTVISINEGRYLVSGTSSSTSNINIYYDMNATDQFILQLGHNSNEIQLGLVLDPTILPKNRVLLGFQRQIPDQYGWGINYEYRERTKFRVEHRLGANVNYYLLKNIQWFGGARDGFPSPWNNKLFYSGLTLFTNLPTNFTLTGYWGRQQFGGSTSAYAIDFSKEFLNHTFYDLGTAYSPSQKNWELHGRFILPITKHHAVEGLYGHYFVINTTEYSLGWRIYF